MTDVSEMALEETSRLKLQTSEKLQDSKSKGEHEQAQGFDAMDGGTIERGGMILLREEVFGDLVRRHVNLVFSVALRIVRQREDAEDVTQEVFALLARKAGRLKEGTVLAGWLYETTRFVALRFMRTKMRRQLREEQAEILRDSNGESVWRQLAPLLEEGMARLSERERTLLALRFFENRTGAQTAAALGIQEWAARKRVERAVEKLRSFFARRGVGVSAGALTAAMSAHSVQAAPPALAGAITTAAMAKVAVSGASGLTIINGALKVMAWTANGKAAVVVAVVIASVVAPMVVQYRAHGRASGTESSLRNQANELARLRSENERLAGLAARTEASHNELNDLEKLRAEVPRLRQQTNEVARLREEKRRLRARTNQERPRTVVQEKEDAMAKMSYQKHWMLAFIMYANEHGNQFPLSFEDAAGFAPKGVTESELGTDQFEVVYQGSRSSLAKPAETIVLRERDAWQITTSDNENMKWAKTYGFADGHCELHAEPRNDFQAYEREHMVE